MSPEQARGKLADKRTDIWAFGCVLYEMLTGRAPFTADTITDTLAAIIERDPDWRALPDATSEALRRLLRRCLQKEPARRVHDIADARLDLEDAESLPASSVGEVPASRVRTSARERTAWAYWSRSRHSRPRVGRCFSSTARPPGPHLPDVDVHDSAA
jgi:serine/threonine protein kinase